MTIENVFSLSPDPRYFYVTPSIEAALNKTRYVINNKRGLTTIVGDIGLGKSSLMRLLYNEYGLQREAYTAALMVNPNQPTATAFLKAICREYGVETRRSRMDTEYELRAYLIQQHRAGKTVILFIDEAQQLTGQMFEQIRQLLNFEDDAVKLLNIVLAGQVEMRLKLADKSKRALVSRIALTSTMDALTLDEVKAMVAFRFQVANVPNMFTNETCEILYQWSKGRPRDVVKLADTSLLYAIANGTKTVTPDIVLAAQNDTPQTPEQLPVKAKGTMREAKA